MVALAVRTGRLLIAATVVALAVTAAAGTVDPTSAGPGLVVNSVLHPGAGGCNAAECTLHEALIDANANAGQDAISFDPLVFPPGTPATILMSAPELSASNDPEGVIIDGTGAGVIIDGGDLVGTEAGLVFHSAAGGIDLTGVVVRSLTVQNFPGYGIRVCGGPIIECDEDLSGTELRNVNVLGNGDEGIQIDGANISNTTLADCNSSNNARAGVRVDALLQLTFTSVSACTANDNERQGIWLDGNGVSNATINDSTVTGNGNSGVWIDTDNATDITNVSLDGVTAQGNDRGVQISTTGTVTGVSLSSVTSSSNERRGIEIKGFDLTDIDISDTTTNNNIAGEGIAFYVSGVLSGATISNCVSNGNTTLGINLDSIGAITDLIVTGCSLSDNGDQGARVRSVSDVTDVTFESVTAAGNGGAGILIATAGDNTGTSVTGSTVSDNAGGIHLDTAGQTADATVKNNIATDNTQGIRLEGTGGITNASVESNTLMNNAIGIGVDGPAAVHFNRIVGNTVGAEQTGAGTLDAENNWWGCNTGPNTAGCDSTTGDVDDDPWLLLDLTVDPATISVFSTSTLTADLTGNSDGEDTSGEGYVQNGILIMFATDLGNVGSKQIAKLTSNGLAKATLTPDEGAGGAGISATLDNETVSETVEITPSNWLRLWADVDCSNAVNPVDSLKLLRFDAGLSVSYADSCPLIGGDIPGFALAFKSGDADCSESVNPVDSLKILRHDAALPVSQADGCPEIGTPI